MARFLLRNPTDCWVVAVDIVAFSRNVDNAGALLRDRSNLCSAVEQTTLFSSVLEVGPARAQFLGDELRIAIPRSLPNVDDINDADIIKFAEQIHWFLQQEQRADHTTAVRIAVAHGTVSASEHLGATRFVGDGITKACELLVPGGVDGRIISDKSVLDWEEVGTSKAWRSLVVGPVKSRTGNNLSSPSTRPTFVIVIHPKTMPKQTSATDTILSALKTVKRGESKAWQEVTISISPSAVLLAVSEASYVGTKRLLDAVRRELSSAEPKYAFVVDYGEALKVEEDWLADNIEASCAIKACRIAEKLQPGEVAFCKGAWPLVPECAKWNDHWLLVKGDERFVCRIKPRPGGESSPRQPTNAGPTSSADQTPPPGAHAAPSTHLRQQKTARLARRWTVLEHAEQSAKSAAGSQRTPMAATLAATTVTLADLDQVACLLLLGEPGAGKSTELNHDHTRVARGCDDTGDVAHRLDLREFGEELRLENKLFHSEVMQRWQQGSGLLWLHLDSLDECRLSLPKVANILLAGLRKIRDDDDALGRLRLRMACRVADRPNVLAELETLFHPHGAQTLVLTPLDDDGIRAIVDDHGVDEHGVDEHSLDAHGLDAHSLDAHRLDATGFMAALTQHRLMPLAQHPITLLLLIKTPQLLQHESVTRATLYQHGCLTLCTEQNPSYLDNPLSSDVDPEDLLELAAFMAALLVLSNRNEIHRVTTPQLPPNPMSLAVNTIVKAVKKRGTPAVGQTKREVLDTLNTALFTASASGVFRFTHWTFAEYLAAKYLARSYPTDSATTRQQISALMMDTQRPGGRVIPQLVELASWLVRLRPELTDLFIDNDPHIVLAGYAGSGDPSHAVAVISAVLDAVENLRTPWQNYRFSPHWAQLNPRDVAPTLVRYIKDTTLRLETRYLALDMAGGYKLAAVVPALQRVIEDGGEPAALRSTAAHTATKCGDATTLGFLRRFVENQPDDSDDEIKGAALLSLWPAAIATEDMLAALTPPRHGGLFGNYASFLDQMPRQLKSADEVAALRWARSLDGGWDSLDTLNEVASAIVRQGWSMTDEPKVVAALADVALVWAAKYQSITAVPPLSSIKQEFNIAKVERRAVIMAIMRCDKVDSTARRYLAWADTGLIQNSDLDWILAQYPVLAQRHEREHWAAFVVEMWHQTDDHGRDKILAAAWPSLNEPCDELHQALSVRIAVVELETETADAMRQAHERDLEAQAEWAAERAEHAASKDKIVPQERVEARLKRAEGEEVEAWWVLCQELTLKVGSRHYGEPLQPNILAMPGWEAADEATRSRIIAVAHAYLLEATAKPDEWLGKNVLYFPDMAAYRALLLLAQVDERQVRQLPVDVWKKWAPIVLGYPGSANSAEHNEWQPRLTAWAYKFAPSELLATLTALLRFDAETTGHLFVLRLVEDCADEALIETVLNFAEEVEELTVPILGSLAEFLIRNRSGTGWSWAMSHLRPWLAAAADLNESTTKLLVELAAQSLAHSDGEQWGELWSMVVEATETAPLIMLRCAELDDHSMRESMVTRLEIDQLAGLYRWLCGQFPRSEDPQHRGTRMHLVTARDDLKTLRDRVVAVIVTQQDDAARDALRSLADDFPAQFWLQQHVLTVSAALRREDWRPDEPLVLAEKLQAQAARRGGAHG